MMREKLRWIAALLLATNLGIVAPGSALAAGPEVNAVGGAATSTPIKHLVVIFQENVSFDHYFGTYPRAANPSGQPFFSPEAPHRP